MSCKVGVYERKQSCGKEGFAGVGLCEGMQLYWKKLSVKLSDIVWDCALKDRLCAAKWISHFQHNRMG